MKRNKFHVTKTKSGWQGKKVGNEKASTTGSTKNEVVKKTIEIAENQGNSSVRIHKKDGKIQEERTYPRKSDPYPPRG